MIEERAYWLIWSQIKGVGPMSLYRLQQHFGNLAEAWIAKPTDLQQVNGFGKQTVESVIAERAGLHPEKFLEEHQQKNPCFWTPADADYPRLLLEIPNPPPVLYYRGKVDLKENQGIRPTVGIVGTRSPSEYGKRWTRKISAALAKRGFTVVSGLAAGIDTEAHAGCLDSGGRTLAIFGTGVDLVYPAANKKLAERVLEQGLVISEYPAGSKPHKAHFPQRNRIIAGLSRAVLVMEAPQKSGALITAYQANDFCRDVYVLTARLDDERSFGCLELLSKGAHPILPSNDRFISEERLLEMLGAMPQLDTPQLNSLQLDTPQLDARQQLSMFPENARPSLQLEPELAQVLEAVGVEPIAFDLIVERVGLAPGEVSSALLQLELLELVSQLPGMRYQRC